jgi:hypothetical protein
MYICPSCTWDPGKENLLHFTKKVGKCFLRFKKTERGNNNKRIFPNTLLCSSTNLVKNSCQVCSAQFDLYNYVDDYGAPLELSEHFVHEGPLDISL